MAVNLSPVGGVAAQFFDNSGQVLTGGKLYTYLAGTTTPAITYTSSTGLTAQPNPIILNAAGRVPDSGEIWLTDGISYKFVLKDQNDVLIATYDNVIGINSNFINFTGEEETQTATQGQTVFTLTTLNYQPGTNNLLVFVNGSKQVLVTNFNETSSTVVTFVDGLNVGDVVDFCTATPINTATIAAGAVSFTGFKGQVGNVQDLADNDGSDWVGFIQAGTGATAISAQDKMRQIINVEDFGAVGNGTTDDGVAIQNAINYASSVKGQVNFKGSTYLVQNAIEIKSNVGLKGVPGTVLFVSPSCTLGPTFGGLGRAIYINTASTNIFIEGITFQSTSTGLTKVVSIGFQNVTNLYINNCQFKNFGNVTYTTQGLVIFSSSDVTITNSTFANNTSDGCAFSNNVVDYNFSNNICSDNGDWGFALVEGCNYGSVTSNIFKNNTSTGTGTDRCSYVSFSNNQMYNNEHGIRISQFAVSSDKNQYITISNNNIVTTGVAGISVENMNSVYGQFSIVNNNISGSSNQGIRISDSRLGTIVGNTIYSCSAEGILFSAVTAGSTTGLSSVVGNTISNTTYGIRQLAGAGTTAVINVVGNYIQGSSVANTLFVDAKYLDFNNATYASFGQPLNFPSGLYSGSATTGGISTPAQVQGYLPLYLSGTLYKIPFYNA